jgi:hypothetical protein
MAGAMDMFGAQAYPGVPSMGSIYDYGQPRNSFADPQAMALLGLAQGLFKAGGASPMPGGIGGALGQGIGGALSGAMGAQHMNQQQQLVDLEKAKADMTRQQLLQAQRQFQVQQDLLSRFMPQATPQEPTAAAGGGLSPNSAAAVGAPWAAGAPSSPSPVAPQSAPQQFPFDPTQIAMMRIAGLPDLSGAYKIAQPDVEVKDGVMYDKHSGKVVTTIPTMNQQGFSTQLVPDGKGGWTVAQTPGGLDAFLAQQRAGARATAERDLVTVPATGPNTPPTYRSRESLLPGAPNAGGTGVGGAPAAGMAPAVAADSAASAAQKTKVAENYASIYNNLQNAAMSNSAKIAKVERVGSLLEGFEGGKLSKSAMDFASAANSLGLKIDPKLPNKQAAEALSKEMALDLRSTANGAGMPGAMSDADRDYLKSMTPDVGSTAEGRKMIVEAKVALLKRESTVADMARQYTKKHGGLNEDFFTQLQGWSERNPIFKK